MGSAHVQRGLERIVVGVSNVAEAVADTLEGERLEGYIELLSGIEVRRAGQREGGAVVGQSRTHIGKVRSERKVLGIELVGPESACVAAVCGQEVTLRAHISECEDESAW